MNRVQEALQQYADTLVTQTDQRFAKAAGPAPIRRKCFLSYHTADAEEVLTFLTDFGDVFIPRTVGVTDEDDFIDSESTDYVMQRIRSKYLAGTTVTIVLIGECTWARRYVDWEVYSTLRDDPVNTRSGLMAVTLPSMSSDDSRQLPYRVQDNVWEKEGIYGYARWWKYPASKESLRSSIETAFAARSTVVPINSRARKMRSSSC